MYQVKLLKAFKDNYIFVLIKNDLALVVDPGESEPVINFLESENLRLHTILLTHHHPDHIGGVDILHKSNVNLIGPRGIMHNLSQEITEDMTFTIGDMGLEINAITTPGHTLDHISYYVPRPEPMLFCGDTLFSVGCGRLFEGSPLMMYESLNKIRALPSNTKIFCAHEYTMENIKFAKSIDSSNKALLEFELLADSLVKNNRPTIPSILASELEVNPFLRCDDINFKKNIQKITGETIESPVKLFEIIRGLKDLY